MYGKGKYAVSLNLINDLLKDIGLLEERMFDRSEVEKPASLFRNTSYKEIWTYYIKNMCYDFMLKDSSILIFNCSKEPSYVYYGCPYECLGYKDYLASLPIDPNEEDDSFNDHYLQYLVECNLYESPNTIRYDYEQKNYNEGLHPLSHLHIGYRNQIRIGFNKVLDPISFIYFLLRQFYPSYWQIVINDEKRETSINDYINKLLSIDERYYNKKDQWEFYLK